MRTEQPEGVASAFTTLLSQFQTHPQTLLEPGLQTSLAPCKNSQGSTTGRRLQGQSRNHEPTASFRPLDCILSPSGSQTLPTANSKQQDPVEIFPPPPEPVLTRPRPFRHQHHPTVCHLRSQNQSSRGGSQFPGLFRIWYFIILLITKLVMKTGSSLRWIFSTASFS